MFGSNTLAIHFSLGESNFLVKHSDLDRYTRPETTRPPLTGKALRNVTAGGFSKGFDVSL